MATERELNLLIRARDEASKVIKQNQRAFDDLELAMDDVGKVARSSLRTIPEELKPIRDDIDKVGREFRELGRTAGSVDELNNSLQKTRIAASGLTSVSSSGKKGIKVMQDLAEVTKKAELAALGLSENGDIRLTTAEAQTALTNYQGELQKTKEQLEELRKAGNFGAYTAGMIELERSTKRVNTAMAAANQGGMAYFNTLKRLGIYSSNTADFMALSMENYKDRFIQSIDLMQQRSTQGEKIQQNFERMGRPLQGITRMLNGISSDLERTARAGTPAALALKELGPNASMKDLLDHVRLINQGIMRMQALTVVAGIALIAFTAVMAKAASGPNVAETLQKQQEALQEYKDTLEERTQEIYDAWGLFEKAQIQHTSGEQLLKNLEGQVKALEKWSSNLGSLAKKGVDEGFLQELREMGPAAAGEIAALNNMTGPQLDQYVELWRQKHNLAKVAAVTELEGLKEETKKKIQDLQDSLKPLGLSAEKFKKVWADALGPFVEVWGQIAAKIVDFGTAIGEAIVKLNEINPGISASAGMFMYLFTALTLLMSPLAVGISRAGGMAAAFTALWGTIGPLVTGFLAVAGYAAVIAAALVALGYVMVRLWQNSEDLRESIVGGWNKIKQTVMDAIAPLGPLFEGLKASFMIMVASFTGGGSTMGSIWQAIGDKIAVVINGIVGTFLPILKAGIGILVTVVSALIQGLIFVFQGITNWWDSNGPMIMTHVNTVKNVFLQGFEAVRSFIMQVMPQVQTIITTAIQAIAAIFNFVFPILKAVAEVALMAILAIFKFVWPFVESLIKSTFNNIKAIITSGLAIIQNVFELFKNLFTGNWSGMWENIKAILSNAWTFLVNFFQVWGLSKMLGLGGKLVSGMVGKITQLASQVGSKFKGMIDDILAKMKPFVDDMINVGKDMIKGLIKGVTSMAAAAAAAAIDAVKGAIEGAKKLLKINSPSKVFIEMGAFTSEGLAIGIEKMASLAAKASEGLAQGVINPVQHQVTSPPSVAPYRPQPAGGSARESQPIVVNFHEGAFKGAFPGVTSGEEVTKAVSGVSLKAAFKAT